MSGGGMGLRVWVLSAVVVAAFGAARAPGISAQEVAPIEGDPIRGRRIFAQGQCVRCHAIWGNGGDLGPDFATAGAGQSLYQLAGTFWNHTSRMIESARERGFAWPLFTESELADMISYVYYVKLFDQPGDPSLGERWFVEKGCEGCHAVGGEGGSSAPPLDAYARYIAPIALAEGLWNHGPAMQQQAVRRGRAVSFLGREIADIQAYIRAASSLRGRQIEFLEPPNPNTGAGLFVRKRCADCHGRAGRGTALGPDLRAGMERLHVSEIAGRIWNHVGAMAQSMEVRGVRFPQFRGSEMADVIAFLYYLRFYEADGDARQGERVFVDKGCLACHALDGQAAVAPDLSESASVLTPLGLATAMWNHAPAMYDQIRDADVEWPRFEDDEMRDLAAYLRALALQEPQGEGGTRRVP
jgi:mono/diheme cytochrome c family protein